MRNLTEQEKSLLEGYVGDHGETSDGKGNILERWDNRELEKHKVLMHNQLWEIFNQRFEEEAPLHKQINYVTGAITGDEGKALRDKKDALHAEYEWRKAKIYAAKTCDEAHEAAHYPMEMLKNATT